MVVLIIYFTTIEFHRVDRVMWKSRFPQRIPTDITSWLGAQINTRTLPYKNKLIIEEVVHEWHDFSAKQITDVAIAMHDFNCFFLTLKSYYYTQFFFISKNKWINMNHFRVTQSLYKTRHNRPNLSPYNFN